MDCTNNSGSAAGFKQRWCKSMWAGRQTGNSDYRSSTRANRQEQRYIGIRARFCLGQIWFLGLCSFRSSAESMSHPVKYSFPWFFCPRCIFLLTSEWRSQRTSPIWSASRSHIPPSQNDRQICEPRADLLWAVFGLSAAAARLCARGCETQLGSDIFAVQKTRAELAPQSERKMHRY